MNIKRPLGDIDSSICEAAFEEYTKLDDSLTELIHKNCIEVRDFVILSFVCDQGALSTEQISQILGLSMEKTRFCIERLIDADLIQYKDKNDDEEANGDHPISLTDTGRMVTLRVHGLPE